MSDSSAPLPVVSVRKLERSFPLANGEKLMVLKGLDLQIYEAEMVAIVLCFTASDYSIHLLVVKSLIDPEKKPGKLPSWMKMLDAN